MYFPLYEASDLFHSDLQVRHGFGMVLSALNCGPDLDLVLFRSVLVVHQVC